MTVVFADTNIVVYAFGVDAGKLGIAEDIVKAAPVISTQVVNEFHNVARRKLGLDLETRHRVATDLLQSCRVVAVDRIIALDAMRVEAIYGFSYWDSLILSAALSAGCDILYSEDMQDGQVIDGRLIVKNPFIQHLGQ
jgi:predicted nucleic acid-binding protein